MRAQGARVDVRGDDFHIHFVGREGESDVVLEVEALWRVLNTIRPAVAAYAAEVNRTERDGAPDFERIERLERLDSLARH